MKKILTTFSLLVSCYAFSQNVGIGITTPVASGKLHIHDSIANQDVSLVLTNSLTGANNLRGARLRLINSDVVLINYEATGKINFSTNFFTRMTLDATGNVGIGNLSPTHKLDIVNNNNTNGINILHTGTGIQGMAIDMGYAPNNTGIRIFAPYNSILPNYSTGLHAVSGNGPFALTQNDNYGIIGECRNASTGTGVFGISNSPSSLINSAGVVGYNFSSAADAYGVIGFTNSTNGAGVAARTDNASTGIYGISQNATGPAIKAECIGTSTTSLELKNGAIKVSGTNKSVFRITAQTGININNNQLIIPNTTLANDPNDLLIVTPVYNNVYLLSPIGVWWNSTNWTIFTQDQSAMPNNVQFNVMVIKQ